MARRPSARWIRVALVSAVLALPGAFVLRAGEAPQGGQGPAPAPRPLVPLTAGSIVRNLPGHLGLNASMMAAVEVVLSKTVFVVDQDKAKATGQEVVVIAPSLQAAPDLNAYLTVQGEVIRFDPEEIAKKARAYVLDVAPDVIARYRGKPAILATAVITSDLTDLAKRPIPPMTPDDVALSAQMRAINPAFSALRGGLETPDAAQLKTQLATIRKGFADAETVFKARALTDAMTWSAEALALLSAMEQSAAGAKWDEIKASAGRLQQLCAACHAARRERMEDGTYRLKTGG